MDTPARVRRIEARGTTFFAPGEIYRLIGANPGDRFDFRKWEEGQKAQEVGAFIDALRAAVTAEVVDADKPRAPS